MKNVNKKEPVMKFVFQTIKLDQVADLVSIQYRSKYEAIRTQVIEKIRTMPDDETFIFQPQDHKIALDDNLIARICHGINTALVRGSLDWKIAYSMKAKAFVVAPFKRRQSADRKISKDKIRLTPEDEKKQINNLLELTHQHFGKTLKDLQAKYNGHRNSELTNVKKALLYVGRNTMGITLNHMGKLLGMNSSVSSTYCQRAMKDPTAKEYVKVLTEAVTNNGGGH